MIPALSAKRARRGTELLPVGLLKARNWWLNLRSRYDLGCMGLRTLRGQCARTYRDYFVVFAKQNRALNNSKCFFTQLALVLTRDVDVNRVWLMSSIIPSKHQTCDRVTCVRGTIIIILKDFRTYNKK